eukprot:TRINITY_DN16824_c0_g1_i2.p1 TRINITY_DN16824_c0_g1~~TRINITY_DN16824_c0_g1_i2.p1  ORF type:complete len:427 (+),score=47.70 TRINITY_DN16824_c0_g1_i2:49-1329(+)
MCSHSFQLLRWNYWSVQKIKRMKGSFFLNTNRSTQIQSFICDARQVGKYNRFLRGVQAYQVSLNDSVAPATTPSQGLKLGDLSKITSASQNGLVEVSYQQECVSSQTVPTPWCQLETRHVTEAMQFDPQSLEVLFREADKMQKIDRNSQILAGFVMATLFYEPSTRTRLSFEAAMMKLGGQVISTEQAANFSSAAKGETLQDTIRTVEGYSDLIVIRHPESGSAKAAAEVAAVPIISAGDGPGEHPTQALLDLYTIRQEIGSLDEKFSIAMIGDLQNGRTVHSLAYLLSQYPNIDMYFVSPKEVKLPQKILSFLEEEGVRCIETENLQDVAKTCRVLYNTRIQKERFQNQEVYERVNGSYIIDKNLLNDMMENAVILHPLPRNTEITPEVDSDCRAAYFRQARNGLFIRMALLKLALLGADNCEFD